MIPVSTRSRRLERWPLVLPALLGLACGFAAKGVEPSRATAPGTKVAIVLPEGFVKTEEFTGFKQTETGSSIMVLELPGPAETYRAAMTAEALAQRGMTLLSREDVRFADGAGLLIDSKQNAGQGVFRNIVGLFGSGGGTVMIVASFPEPLASSMRDPLRRAVLSAAASGETISEPFAGLPFRFSESERLVVIDRSGGSLLLGPPGSVRNAGGPFLIVGGSEQEIDAGNLESIARLRFMKTPTIVDLGESAGRALVIDGHPAYELTAAAKLSESGLPVFVFQTVVSKGSELYFAQGIAPLESRDRHLREFRDVTSTLSFPASR